MTNNTDVPIWEKYTLTIEEASKYFRIGEKKLRKLAEENLDAGWVIVNGNRVQIKRKQFEKIIDTLDIVRSSFPSRNEPLIRYTLLYHTYGSLTLDFV